jgi:hypothetical protein
MAEPLLLFKAASGLNDTIDPARLAYDPATGVQDLAVAVNIDIDDSGMPSRRKGMARIRDDVAHSLWSDGSMAYYVAGDSLYQLGLDGTRKGLRSSLTLGARMSYAVMGEDIYYGNGHENGVIRDGASWSWVGESYVGPESLFIVSTAPPLGHMLAVMSGRMLIADDGTIFHSMPFAPSWYRKSVDYNRLTSRVSMMLPLSTGLWCSDQNSTYWVPGTDPSQWELVQRSNHPVSEGTGMVIPGWLCAPDIVGNVAIWAARDGICMGSQDGQIRNLTLNKLSYPWSLFGSAILIGSRYVVVFEP